MQVSPNHQLLSGFQRILNNRLTEVVFTVMALSIFVFGCMQLCGNLPFSSQIFTSLTLGLSASSLLYYSLCAYFEEYKITWYQSTTQAEKAGLAIAAAVIMALAISAFFGRVNIQQLSIGIVSVNAFCIAAYIFNLTLEKGRRVGYKEGYEQARVDFYKTN